jgi:F0F1-type ATP synthase membrane subunit c/vacuolar-type H+-ATPase subunit K
MNMSSQEINAWLMRAETASSVEEAVACLNQANALLPSDPEVKQKTYQIIQKMLKQDPFLEYLAESDNLYHVRSGGQLSLSVPKDRSVPEPYPAERPALLQSAYRWLWMAMLGLLLAGLGAMVFAPLAAVSAIGLNLRHPSRLIRIKSLVVLILSGSLWLCGLLLCVILLVHMI